jgi:hypothetical protein
MSIAQTWSGRVTGPFPERMRMDPAPRRQLRGVRTPVDRGDAQALHQRPDMAPADPAAFAVEQALRHPASCGRMVRMQFIDPAHQRRIRIRDRARRMAPRLIPRAFARRLMLSPCRRPIVALRSAGDPPCRARRPENHSPASARRSWRAASSHRRREKRRRPWRRRRIRRKRLPGAARAIG